MKRPESHVIGEEAITILRDKLPHKWIIRPLNPDYGTDFEVEIVDGDIVTGQRLIIQLKGTKNITYSDGNIRYSMKVEDLEYYMNNDLPVILARVGTQSGEVYWLFVQEYVYEKLNESVKKWREQGSVTLHIPRNNSLPATSDELRTIAERGIIYLVSKSLTHTARIIEAVEKQNLPGGSIILLINPTSNDINREQYIIDIGEEKEQNRISILMGKDQSLIFQLYDTNGIQHGIVSHVNQESWTLDKWHVVICCWSKNPGFMKLYVDTHIEDNYLNRKIEIEDIPDHPSVLIGTDITKTLFAKMILESVLILRYALPESFIKELTLEKFEMAIQKIREIYY